MRIGLVVDSACDLPQSFIEQHGIVILPITLHLGDRDEIDTRDPEKTQRFYEGKRDRQRCRQLGVCNRADQAAVSRKAGDRL